MSTVRQANRVADLLKRCHLKVVFAESCTGGLVSGALTRIPGISQYHCGGMVIYRNATKTAWLDVPARDLQRPGPVSQKVTASLAEAVLRRTPEANLSLAVTGHLGPGAPKRLDGVVFVAIALRRKNGTPQVVGGMRAQYSPELSRLERQRSAVSDALQLLGDFLDMATKSGPVD